MKLPVQVTNDRAVRTVRWIIVGHAFVLTWDTVKHVGINVDVRVLVVREVVVEIGFAIGEFGGGHPLAGFLRNRTVVNPVDHVCTLPRVVTAHPLL